MSSHAFQRVDPSGLYSVLWTHSETIKITCCCHVSRKLRVEKVLLSRMKVLSSSRAHVQWPRWGLAIASAYMNGLSMDAIDASVEALPSILLTRLAIGGAGAGDTGSTWLDFLIAAAERQAVGSAEVPAVGDDFCMCCSRLGTMILVAEASDVGVFYFHVRNFIHVRCGAQINLSRLTILASEKHISGICFLDIFLIFW